jgi:ABC-type multidrug transport system fused ATPase/permease subunit
MSTTENGLAPRTMRVIMLLWSYRRRLLIVAFIVIMVAALGVVNPPLIKPLLFWYVGVMIAVPIVTPVLPVAQNYLTNVLGQRVMRDLWNNLDTHLQHMSLRFFTEIKTACQAARNNGSRSPASSSKTRKSSSSTKPPRRSTR